MYAISTRETAKEKDVKCVKANHVLGRPNIACAGALIKKHITTMKKLIKPSDRESWLKEREKGIGSSEVGTVLGINPFETPYQLWRRKRGLDGPKEENFAMKAGHYLEDAVSRFYADATGKEIIKSSAVDFI